MLVELAKPIALVMCLLSLCAVFNAAFLYPASEAQQRIWDTALLLSLAAGISLSGGMIFRESSKDGIEPVMHTLPVRVFCWAVGAMVLLFVASWYLETHCIFYRDVRRM
jgi:hypothetical protein